MTIGGFGRQLKALAFTTEETEKGKGRASKPCHQRMTWKNLKKRLGHAGYVSSDELSMAIYIALQLERPILLEGDAGVGKTQVAKTIAEIEDTELIRLQCYEGLDAAAAFYEWNYQRQLLSIRASANSGGAPDEIENRIFSREYR